MNTLEIQARTRLDQLWEEWADAATLESERLSHLVVRLGDAKKDPSVVLSQEELIVLHSLASVAAMEAFYRAGLKVSGTQKDDINAQD